MIPIIIKKRALLLIAFALLGVMLLFLSWRGCYREKELTVPGTPVTSSTGPEALYGPGAPTEDEAGQSIMTTGTTIPVVEEQDFFVDYRLERSRMRGQRVEWLREVINNINSSDDTRQKAQDHLMAISRSMEKETELENLIRAKGFKDAAVLVDDRSVTAIIESNRLTAEELSSIAGLVSRSTGVEPQNVVVIPRGVE
ncbi:MAG: Stage III sporulation protein AH [Firmicutes bacterium ADurb.Bin456]|nr:MAG: Stage III sporulation protein AH [Firmicutes bacterium ADurb.Bin456]